MHALHLTTALFALPFLAAFASTNTCSLFDAFKPVLVDDLRELRDTTWLGGQTLAGILDDTNTLCTEFRNANVANAERCCNAGAHFFLAVSAAVSDSNEVERSIKQFLNAKLPHCNSRSLTIKEDKANEKEFISLLQHVSDRFRVATASSTKLATTIRQYRDACFGVEDAAIIASHPISDLALPKDVVANATMLQGALE